MARARELRKVRKHEAEEMSERFKRIKGLQVDVMEKARQARDRLEQKRGELEGTTQELSRVQTRLGQQKD